MQASDACGRPTSSRRASHEASEKPPEPARAQEATQQQAQRRGPAEIVDELSELARRRCCGGVSERATHRGKATPGGLSRSTAIRLGERGNPS
jgi:hypothetical protein